jgi:uncharacterized repeat protein (TIGR03803 family)
VKFSRFFLLLACYMAAQIVRAEPALQTLYTFPIGSTNCYGAAPQIIEGVDGDFYGTTFRYGLSNNCGTVFKVTKTGVLSVLCSFSGTNGAHPFGLTQCSDGNFYGVTTEGGDYFDPITLYGGDGTIFKMTSDGTLTTLYYFNSTNDSGSLPNGTLVLGNDGNLYGATEYTGSVFPYGPNNGTGFGTVFQITTNVVLTTLHTFDGTNGSLPIGGLTLGRDGSFYGVTYFGGNGFQSVQSDNPSGNGTIFKITTNGTFTTLVYFNGTNGLEPVGGLTVGSDGNFYGTTSHGGSDYTGVAFSGSGTVFKMTTNGALTSFSPFSIKNGAQPLGRLCQGQDGNFYGTTIQNGKTNLNGGYGYGTIFAITPQGTFTKLTDMDGTNGASPVTDMILSQDGNLYGTMSDAHFNYLVNGGTFFRLAFSPGVTGIATTNDGVTLSWTSLTNRNYRIEYKSSLLEANWTALATNAATDITTSFTDTSTNGMMRFYRVVLLP